MLPLWRGIPWKRFHISVPVDQWPAVCFLLLAADLIPSHTLELTLFLVDMET